MQSKTKKYTHPTLAEPWEPVFPDLIVTSKAEADKKNLAAMTEKIVALFDHYNISPTALNAYELLSMAMAADHVPGFRLKKHVGRPATWKAGAGLELFKKVWLLADKTGSYRAACAHLVRRGVYKGPTDSLYSRFKETLAKHPASPVMKALHQIRINDLPEQDGNS